jgi:hypothetical protein
MSTESEHHHEPSEEGRAPTEEELRATYEAQIKQVRVEHVLLEHVVTVANLGLRRTGLAPGTEDERDPDQVRLAIESIRILLPLLEESMPEQAAQIKDALSQLQFAFLKISGAGEEPGDAQPPAGSEHPQPGQQTEPPRPGQAEPPEPGEAAPPEPGEPGSDDPGPAQRSGRLWIPGQ